MYSLPVDPRDGKPVSFVFTDPKGELCHETAGFLEANGYEIRVLNINEQHFSDCYNPFRYIRSAVLEILQQDYLRTARAKGIGRFKVIYKHALRNALIPIVTVIGMEIPMLFGGAIIIEQVFSWPGLGLMTMSAISNRDYPVIMGVCLLSAVVVLVGNLLTDILYALVDPTIQLQ